MSREAQQEATLSPLVAPGLVAQAGPREVPRTWVTVRLRDDLSVTLRPLHAGEEEPLREVFDAMSEQSRASRYLTGMTRLVPSMLRALVDIDGHRHVGWLATVGGRPVGLARYVRLEDDPSTAEFALEVVDAQQGRGIGTALTDVISTHAVQAGVLRLRASVKHGNDASRRLMQRIGAGFVPDGQILEGCGRLRLIDPPVVDRAAVRALAVGRA